jgi:predicted house-cleaning noncanonical NTP pyrophosphatase (MazG superfamily)
LAEKLQEEVAELLEAHIAKQRSALDCAEEVADVMEVLCAIGKVCAVSKQDIEQVRSRGRDFSK